MRLLPSALLLALLLVPSALAQSASDILREAIAQYESEMAEVRDYTLTQEMMGTEVQTYAERADGAAPLDYTYYLVTPDGLVNPEESEGSGAPPSPYVMMERITDEARYVGTETVDGTATHVIAVDDFGDLAREFGAVPAEADGEFEIETGTFYIGTADGRMHRMTMAGTITNEGRTSPIMMDTRLMDYRTVDGFTTPYRMVMNMQGMENQMSDEERRELEQVRAQMEAMPAAQRQMMERMMGDKLEQLESMLGGEGFELEMNVTNVKVNTGRPE